jgi:starch phosphorylase
VLYPDDSTEAGRELRLKQEFFLVSASLQDMLARHLREYRTLHEPGALERHPPERHAPGAGAGRADAACWSTSMASMQWDEAWGITRQAVSYTNHTLMPEALETWPVPLFERCCRATWKSSTRSTTLPGRGAGSACPATKSCVGACR